MFRWNSQKIQHDLAQLPDVDRVRINPPGGDVDTEKLVVHIKDLNECLHVCGFSTDEYFWEEPDKGDVDVMFIELCDTSGEGLQSNVSTVALLYINIRQYFIDKGVEVVGSMDGYF